MQERSRNILEQKKKMVFHDFRKIFRSPKFPDFGEIFGFWSSRSPQIWGMTEKSMVMTSGT